MALPRGLLGALITSLFLLACASGAPNTGDNTMDVDGAVATTDSSTPDWSAVDLTLPDLAGDLAGDQPTADTSEVAGDLGGDLQSADSLEVAGDLQTGDTAVDASDVATDPVDSVGDLAETAGDLQQDTEADGETEETLADTGETGDQSADGVAILVPQSLTAVASTTANREISLSWINTAQSVLQYNLYFGTWPIIDTTGPKVVVTPGIGATTSFAHTGLDLHVMHYAVTAVTTEGESGLSGPASATTPMVFRGLASDFFADDAINGSDGKTHYIAWSASRLFVGMRGITSGAQRFFIAIDTDPPGDATGNWAISTVGQNHVTWPFKANVVIEVTPNLLNSVAEKHSWNGATWDTTPLAGSDQDPRTYDGDELDQVWIAKSELGDPATMRIAIASWSKGDGDVFAFVPDNGANATEVFGYFASMTGSLDLGGVGFVPQKRISEPNLLTQANALVKIQLNTNGHTVAAPIMLKSTHPPFSTVLGNTRYSLNDGGVAGDAVASDGIFSGLFNLAGSTAALTFAFNGDGTDEFGDATQRQYPLSGDAESLPTLEWSKRYIDANGLQIAFSVLFTGIVPEPGDVELRGNLPNLSWNAGITLDGPQQSVFNTTVLFPPASIGQTLEYKYCLAPCAVAGDWEPFQGNRTLLLLGGLDIIGKLDNGAPQPGIFTQPQKTWGAQ